MCNQSYAQGIISGLVRDSVGRGIAFATVQLMCNNKPISFTASDEKGSFEMQFTQQGSANFSLKISHINFETKSINIENLNKKIVVTLEEKKTALKEIVVQNRIGVVKMRGDTLSYNLKALTTGNEEKLKDILKKLPGIEINEDGKIMAQGKVLDNLLINGKKMFGDNHKIATENISAEMVGGIDLLNNYENFAPIKAIEGSNKTALNVQIKESYLGKITGNIDLFGGYENRYQAHSNLFRFDKNSNVSAIVNLNNTGYQPLSMKDYFSMNKSVRQEMRNKDFSTNSLSTNEIPKFLLSDNNVKSKSNEFIALDFALQSVKNISMNGFSIFSRLKTTETSTINKVFFNNSTSTPIVEFFSSQNTLLYNQTKFNIDYKKNKNNLLNYTALFDPNTINASNKFETDLGFSQSRINELLDKVNFKFGHQLSYISKIDKNKLLSFNLFQELNRNTQNIDLDAGYKLFDISNNLSQKIIEKNNDYGFYSKLTIKKKSHLYKLSTGYVFEQSLFKALNGFSQNDINFKTNYLTTDFSFQKNEGKLSYKAKIEFRHYYLNYKSENKEDNFLLPSVEVKYSFSQTQHLFASYSKTVGFYSAANLNDNSYFIGYQNYYLQSKLYYSTPVEQNIYAINYFKFDLYNGIVILLNSAYTKFGNRLSNNTISAANYIKIQPISTSNQYAWNNIASYECRISKLKTKFKVSVTYISSNFINQINTIANLQTTQLLGVRTSLLSIFKNEFFNYEIGLNYSRQTNKLSIQNMENRLVQLNPFISFNGKINSKLSYSIENAYQKFIAENVVTDFYNLSFKLNYKTQKLKYWIEANNILNIQNAKVIKLVNNNNYTATEVIDRLAGFIGFGVGFSIK